MGIIKHLTAAAAKGAVEYVAYNAIEVAAASADLVSKQIEKGEKKKQQKMVNGNPDGLRFIVQCTDDSKMCKYNVLDKNELIKYKVTYDRKYGTHFYNADGVGIGTVAKRKPTHKIGILKTDKEFEEYDFIVGGYKDALIKSRKALTKRTYEFNFVPWFIEGDCSTHTYKIMNKDKCVAELSKKFWTKKAFAIDIFDEEKALIITMIAITIEMAESE